MAERPIPFSGPMVPPVLADTKTQTRRVVKWRNVAQGLNLSFSGLRAHSTPTGWLLESQSRTSSEWRCSPTPCPYGQVSDRIWVKETFFAFGRWETRFSAKKGRDEWHFVDMTLETTRIYQYAADGVTHGKPKRGIVTPAWWKRPAIFMPRVASRILLEVTEVRVERLQDINRRDALAEGIVRLRDGGYGLPDGEHYHLSDPWQSYFSLWRAINGPGSVEANPWVWAVSFRRLHA